MANLSVGDMVPHFVGKTQDGTTLSLDDLKGGHTVLYFYPKDNTSGCTAEACSLRDNHEALIAKGYNVIGVSKDSAASHRKFIDKYELPFTLHRCNKHLAFGQRRASMAVSIWALCATHSSLMKRVS